MHITKQTLDYYNRNCESFHMNTANIPFTKFQTNFTNYLQPGAYILDCGCGSGRDSKAFLENGYQVDAIDGSTKMCKIASDLIGQDVLCLMFQDINYFEKYDGIWACSSILHLPYHELISVMNKLHAALKPGGYLYASFKYGDFEGVRNGRYFIDMTSRKFQNLLNGVDEFEMVSEKISRDVRPGREDEKWYNVILKKE